MEEQSEFGSGVIVCLVKFSEHLSNDMMMRYVHAQWWYNANQLKRDAWESEARHYPTGDSSRIVAHARSVFMGIRENSEAELLSALAMWANGASDHFYQLDAELAPPKLKILADFMLDLGHGSGMMGKWERSAEDTIDYIWQMWEEATLEIDVKFGSKPDWGQW